MPEHSNNLTSDNESSQVDNAIQEKINQDLKQIYNRMALDVIYQAYKYYILCEEEWPDSLWDRRAREVYLNRHVLEPDLRAVFDKLDENHLSMYFLKIPDYERILLNTDGGQVNVS